MWIKYKNFDIINLSVVRTIKKFISSENFQSYSSPNFSIFFNFSDTHYKSYAFETAEECNEYYDYLMRLIDPYHNMLKAIDEENS